MKLSKIKRFQHKRGFTLIEILLVVSILSVILVVVFAALNPAQRLIDARNANRLNDVTQVLTAIHECIVDGETAEACSGVPTGETHEIVNATWLVADNTCNTVCTGATSDVSCTDLETALVSYLGALPKDPGGVATNHTEYSVTNSAGIITVASCDSEGVTAGVSVTR